MEAKSVQDLPKKKLNFIDIGANAWILQIISIRGSVARWWLYLRLSVLVVFIAYIALPIFLMANSWIIPKLIFSTIVKWPPFVDPSYPSDFGLNSTGNLYFDVEPGVKIGAWHTLPISLVSSKEEMPWEKYEASLSSSKHVFLYLHGNSGSRASFHRIQMYKLLASLDAHVLTIDYRGFADSTGTPTEAGVVKDAYFAYKWLKEKTNGTPIFVWGHSLGTGISTNLVRQLCEEDDPPAGLVLESPFNNIVDAASKHPFAFPFAHIPGFKSFIRDSATEHNIHFTSDKSIVKVTSSILILHAEDDSIVPYNLGEQLYGIAKKSRTLHTGDAQLINFDAKFGYGHKNIYQAPELRDIIRKFMNESYAEIQRQKQMNTSL